MKEGKSAERFGRPGWRKSRTEYACADGTGVGTAARMVRRPAEKDSDAQGRTLPASGVGYRRSCKADAHGDTGQCEGHVTVVVSTMELSRDMKTIIRGHQDLRTVLFPSTVERLAEDAFSGLKLGAVVMNDGLRRFQGREVKSGERNWSQVFAPFKDSRVGILRLPATLRRLEEYALYGLTVKRCELPAGLGEICSNSLAKCECARLTIPASVKRIGYYAFVCGRIKDVVLQEGSELEIIEDQAFRASQIREFAAPPSLREIGAHAFCWSGLTRVRLNERIQVIRRHCFSYCPLMHIVIPSCVRSIGSAVFENSQQLNSIVFEKDSRLASVGERAFWWCFATIYVLPEMKFDIEDHADGRTVVRLPPLDVRVGKATLEELRNTREVSLPDGLETIGRLWFAGSGVEKVSVPASVREIAEGAFAGCTWLESVEFGEGSALERISRDAFRQCRSLGSVVLPEGLVRIEANAFQCSTIKSLTVPSSLRTIAQGAFARCKGLKTVRLNEGLTSLGTEERRKDGEEQNGVFEGCEFESIELPSTLRRIEDCAFRDCLYLLDIRLPDGLEYIGKECFAGSKLATVRIPKAGVRAGESAFRDCPAKDAIVFRDGRVFPKE